MLPKHLCQPRPLLPDVRVVGTVRGLRPIPEPWAGVRRTLSIAGRVPPEPYVVFLAVPRLAAASLIWGRMLVSDLGYLCPVVFWPPCYCV